MSMASPTQEGHDTLSVINHPPTRLPGPNLLHFLVPDRSQTGQPAVDFLSSNGSRETLSYSELHHQSEKLALRISALLGPRETSKPFVVPVLVPQHPKLYVALLAILKAGGAFCPLNLDVPVERARFILQDVSARIVITTSELSSKLPEGQSCLFVDEGPVGPLPGAKHRKPSQKDLAYVMYTSGSTGTPKGVGISHDAVTQSLLAHDRHIPPFSRFLQFAAPTFDVSVFEIFFPLFRGTTLVSCTRRAMLNDLPGVIRQMDVDACELTPSVAGSLLRNRERAPRLRFLLTIGEMLTQPIIEEFGGSDEKPSMLWGMYGPTEAAIHCTLQPAFACSSSVRNIGVPLDTVSSFVLAIPETDTTCKEFEILPRGEIGELAVGGHQLAEGYFNRPEQTSSAFIDSPYGRLYRTGDKAKILPDGTLECLGRISDGQVKLRGQRMELGEVEHAALRTPGCHSAVAAIVDATLLLFCAVDKPGDMAARITHSCQQWLPGFMLPGDIVVLESFPRLTSGKIDRKTLVADHRAKASGITRSVQYRDDVEQQLCELAGKYFDINIDPKIQLSTVGLDSLSAIGLASMFRRAGHKVGAIDVLEARTISGIYSALLSAPEPQPSDLITESLDSMELDVSELAESHPALARRRQQITSVTTCTALQAAMLAETMANPRAYCNWVEISFAGSLTDEEIRSWFVRLGNTNDILRTGFVHHRNQFWQVTFDTFAASNISATSCTKRGFEMREDNDFLCPFRVQIGHFTGGGNRTVVVQLHHAVYDGWSVDLMLRDLAKLVRGEEPVRRTQFQQLTAYYQSAVFRSTCDVAREFWAGNLHGFQPAALPILNPNPELTSTVKSSTVSLRVSPQRVKEALFALDCGPQTVFQAALAWLWGSITGSQDVVVGTVHSGRTLPITGIEDAIGPCIAVVPLRTDLSHVRTVRDLLINIQTGNRATLRHSALSLSEIKRAAGVRPSQPLYDVLFVYQETLHSRGARDNLVSLVAQQDYPETKLLVEVEPGAQDLVGRFTYHSDVFTESFISFVADSISVLVPYLLGSLDSDVESISTALSSRHLSVYNSEPLTFSGIPDLAHAVERTAARFPDRDAVCFAERIDDGGLVASPISFAELNQTADQISLHLMQNGVCSGGIVAIIMEKSIRLYAGILAILKAGCAYLPLLPSTPIARVETILRQAKVAVSLVDTTTRAKLVGNVSSAFIDLESLELQHTPAAGPGPRQSEPSRLAYIIYTSGSTGVPKGVCVTQLNIMSNLDVLSRIYPVSPGSRLLQSCSQAFDVSVFEIFFAWTQGMCLCSGTNDTLFEDLERSIRNLGVTHLSMTPTVASLIEPDNVPSVQFLVTAGEAMTEAVARKWSGKLFQGYGPSETTNICSVKKMGPKQVIQHLGWSFENTSTFVLATDGLHPVPFGCLGEFCFGGDQVAQEYLGMDELTSAKFIDHPKFGRIYRSGDLGRMLPDGSMVIVGRTDEQVKIRGQRVELNEITETIRQSGDVADCTTMLLLGSEMGAQDQIVSYLVPRRSQTTEFKVLEPDNVLVQQLQSLYHFLSSRLASYVVPSAIVPISLLPTTPSGKLDRSRLAQAFATLNHDQLAALSYGANLYADDAGWSAVETQIAEIVSDSLHVSRNEVQRWTPLAMLGLDSISAIQVSKHLHTKLGRRFPISFILQNPSVARLAQSMPAGTPSKDCRAVADLLPKQLVIPIAERLDQLGKRFTRILPCTALQEAMLAASSAQGQYLNRMLFRVHGDLGSLKNAWDAMSLRHDILRTCFVTTDEVQWPFLQIVLQQHSPLWQDFCTSYQDIGSCIQQQAQAVPSALNSLEPAVSFATITQGDNVYFSLVCHHALYDGVAIERLMHEVEEHLRGNPLPPPPCYEQFLGESLALPASTENFWREHLAGHVPRLTAELSWDTEYTSKHLCRTNALLDMPLSQILARVRELGVSLLAVTQSAWASTLASIFQTNDVCFGNVVSGRLLPIENVNDLVAPCFNTIPVRMNFASTHRNLDVLKAFYKLNTEAMPYQFTPLRRIQSLHSQHGGQRLFDTLLLLQQSPRVLDQSVWALERDEGEMDVPLVVEVIPDTHIDRLVIRMHTIESNGLDHELKSLFLDLLLIAFMRFLKYPGSSPSLDGIPQGLEKRVTRTQVRRPQPLTATHDGPPDATGGIWTVTEISIRQVFATLSHHDPKRIQRNTTIYQLGLDSISAAQLASMLQKIGFDLAASDVIEHPTCQSLARYIDARPLQAETPTTYDLGEVQIQLQKQVSHSGLSTEAIEAFIPCTPLQCSMMTQFTVSGGRDYFNFVTFELTEGSTPSVLREAWLALCRTHAILRTAIVPVEHDTCAFAMLQYRSSGFDPSLTIIPEERTEGFDLEDWRLETARLVAQSSHERLWAVAILQGKQNATMHLAIHHVLYDAHSLQTILGDLAKAARGTQLLPRSRTEEVVADILGQISATDEHSTNFWKEQANRVVINRFPTLTPLRLGSQSIRVQSATSSTSLIALEQASSRAGYPLQVILQAAWTRVLSSYLGEDPVVFGVVLSGRNTQLTRNAVFPCITTLPIISTNDNSNRGLLVEMQRYNTGLFKQQHQPLTHIQQWLGYPGTRLFDTLLVYQKLHQDGAEVKHWRILDDSARIDYPVSIEIEHAPGGQLGYQVTFLDDVLDNEQAQLLLQQFDATVQHLALEPDGHEAALSAARPDLFSVSPPEIPQIPTLIKFLHQFVECQALKNPDATALSFVERFDGDTPITREWSYKELDRNANRVARTVLQFANTGDIVAVCFDKCPEAYFSICGILKAGCAFVALDPGAPRARNEFILQDSEAKILLTRKSEPPALDLNLGVHVIEIDENALASGSEPLEPPKLSRELGPNDVCYCLYTSGTTGTPKGCEITHDNAVQCMLAFRRIFEGHWDKNSRWLQFASLHFDVSVLEQYWSWSAGIELVAAPRDLVLEDLAGFISRLQITHIDLTPSLARLLHPDDVPSLCRGVFITGGESLKQEILDVWGSKGVIYNFYGPTEATIGVTVYPRVPTTGRASNIGKQFVNVGSYVLKPGTEQPILRGGVGELCVSGRLVGKGYLKRMDLTATKFPVLKAFGERVYRTGDLVRILHDGCFDFLGRADDQVKLRGQRLEIGEINHTIRREVSAVQDVATLVVRNETQQKDLLVSFIVGDGNQKSRDTRTSLEPVKGPPASELCRRAREACRARLPGYMVPTYVLQLPFIPLSANNKAETKGLRKMFSSLAQDELVSLSASDQTNITLSAAGTKIAKVIAEMQRVDLSLISSDSNIFGLGIDSISVLRLSRSLKREGLAQATPATILRHPVIGDLAGVLEKRHGAYDLRSAVASARQLVQACAHKHRSQVCKKLGILPDQIEYIAPCSPLQQGMLSRAASDGCYFNTFRLVLSPETLTERLRKAFQSTLDTLPILRTRFVSTTDGFVQVALKKADLSWTSVSIGQSTSADEMVRTTRELWIKQNQESFSRPLEVLLMSGADGHVLALHIFHGLYDANSFKLVMDRVATKYQFLGGEPTADDSSVLVPSFLEALCQGPLLNFSSSKQFWIEHVGTMVSAPAPVPQHGSSVISCRRRVSFQGLERLRLSLRVTHQTLVQAAWAGVLAKHTTAGSTTGVVVSGRSIDLENADKVVGPMFNTLPFRAQVHEDLGTTWKTLIRQCHDFNTAVLPFQHVPLRDIQKWCSGGKALFNALFSFQQDEAVMAKDKCLWKVIDAEPNADYPLALEAALSSDGWLLLELVAQHVKDEPNTLSNTMDQLELALGAMTENPEQTVLTSHLLTGATKDTNSNAQSKLPAPNGLSATTHLSKSSFTWTKTAVVIRDEMAALAITEPDCINETTSLFGLGLDSVDAIKLSARLKRRGITVKVSDLMRSQTIRGMLEGLESRNHDTEEPQHGSTAKQIHKTSAALRDYAAGLGALGDKDIVLPLTPLQESMVIEMIESDFRLYFNHDVIELAPNIEIPRLKDAWGAVVAGSPVLRTRFLPVESPAIPSSYCQIIGSDPTVHIGEVSLDSHDELAKICKTATLRAHKGAGQSNLVQLTFATIKAQKFLVVSMAHALYDGLSLGLIHRDVRLAYEGSYQLLSLESYVNRVETVLHAAQQRDSGQIFWSEFLQGATPTLFPRRKVDLAHVTTIHRDELISSLSSSEVATSCKSGALTLQALGQACWAAVLAAETRTLDVTFGVVLSCRDMESLEHLPFPTMNTVLVRSVLHGTGLSWLQYMQENINRISAHQHFPLRDAQKLAQANGPLFNTLFIQQRRLSSPPEHEDGRWMNSVGGSSAVEYPICVEIEMAGPQLIWRMACEDSYASQNKTRRMLRQLDQLLVHFVRSPEANVVRFTGSEVSICNLPSVALQTKVGISAVTEQDATDGEHEDWHPLEATIRDILAEVSGVTPATISKRNNIYHLGLDSVSAIKAVALLRRRGLAVGLRDMLHPASILDMARLATDAQRPSSPAARDNRLVGFPNLAAVDTPAILLEAEIEASAVQDVLPATPMQVHMLSVWQNTRGEVFYPCFQYTLHGPVDVNDFDWAWRDLLAQTPILRTVFVSTKSRSTPVLQVVLQPSALEECHAFAEDTAWKSKTRHSISQPFHSLQARKDKQGSWHLQLKIHHALYDAVSLPAIMDRFLVLCQGHSAGTPTANYYENWRTSLASHCADNNRAARQQFWTKYLAGAGSPLLTQSSAATETSTGRVSAVRHSAFRGISSITERCRASGVSLQALFFAAYAECLVSQAVRSGRDKPERIVFGIYLANRGDTDGSEAAIYPTLRLVPLSVELGRGGVGLLDTVAAIQQDLHVISSPVNVDVGLWEIKDWTNVVIDSFVNFLGGPSGPCKTILADTDPHELQRVWLELAEGATPDEDLGTAGSGSMRDSGNQGEGSAREVAGNLVRDAYPDAVDVEVLVKDDEMTIGVFGSGQRFGGQGADNMIDGIVEHLVAYV